MTDIYMKWRPDFNLGIDEIDNQHKKIVELINVLNEAFMNDSDVESMDKVLSELEDYTKYHFDCEEELFMKNHYPFSKEHVAQHKRFIDKIKAFRTRHNNGEAITFRLLKFLREWFTNHILDADREYVILVKRPAQSAT